MRKRSWDGVHGVGTDLTALFDIVLPGEISPRRPTVMIFSLLLSVPTKAGRNFAQFFSYREFGILHHCLIPAGQQFVFLNLGSINLI